MISDTMKNPDTTPPPAPLPAPGALFEGKPPTSAQTRSNALEAMGGDDSLLDILIPHFGSTISEQSASLRRALAQGDATQVRHWSHTMKGSLLTVGATRTSAVAANIEKSARAGVLEGLQPWVERLCAETEVLIGHFGR